tara:strand:- start:259 stop:438 length:180 start_codon:yes stop_codon:yes gene_type:complete
MTSTKTVLKAGAFFGELEDLLIKYFGDDWMWHYQNASHPLQVFSESLAEAWERFVEDDD